MWRIGIDEAGYGPNLGPLVMTAVAWHVPDELADADLWKTLASVACRVCRKPGKRLLVDDSKKVYRGGDGLDDLECTTLALLEAEIGRPATLADLLKRLGAPGEDIDELWYDGALPLPLETPLGRLSNAERDFDEGCRKSGVCRRQVRSRVVGAPRFNELVDRYDSKGAVLAVGLVELLRWCLELEPAENLVVVVDKHGGRNRYAPLLQEISPDVWVTPGVESMQESVYQVWLSGRSMRITFRPEADAAAFETALASIVSKYVRELCMTEFNAFWRKHLPELTETAGYPGDSSRFLADIRPTLDGLRVPVERIWRKR
jgi:hypothetical protein